MTERIYTLQEAAIELGWEYERLKTKARRSEFSTVDIPYGQHRFKKGITGATLAVLMRQGQSDAYEILVSQYFYEMRTGTWGKGGRPLSERWIALQKFYLNRYWLILGIKPSLQGVSVEHFKKVMASFEIDREGKRDFYSAKMHIYKIITGLMKLLVREGYKKTQDLAAIRDNLPGKVFNLKKDFLDLKDIEEALQINRNWTSGRSVLDRELFHVLLSMYSYAGLRKMESAALRMDQVHLDKGYLHVYGKWATERIVPIFPALMDTLKQWMVTRERYLKSQDLHSDYLFMQIDGKCLTESVIGNRFKRFKAYIQQYYPESLSWKITPHVLRRSCATIASLNGMPDGLIQKMLGHKHSSTTEGYKMTQDRHLVAWAQSFYWDARTHKKSHTPAMKMDAKPELEIDIASPDLQTLTHKILEVPRVEFW